MFTNKPWLLYGATGRTGTLIAETAVARGHRPTLAGRDAARVRALAERLDLPWVAGSVDELDRLIGDAQLVLLAAGPFEATSPPVLAACLRAGVHYLDVANEIAVVTGVLAADDAARERGIAALPAVGFGTVASDGVARYVGDQVPGADQLTIGIVLETAGTSPGARASTLAALAGGGRVRRNGRLVRTRLGAGAHRLPTPRGPRTMVPVPTGDLVTAFHTTGIANITVSSALPLPPLAARVVLPLLPPLARLAGRLPSKPAGEAPEKADAESLLYARATAPDGRTAEAWLRTGEGYAYTAASAVSTVEEVLTAPPIGATTVAAAYGSRVALSAGGEILAAAQPG